MKALKQSGLFDLGCLAPAVSIISSICLILTLQYLMDTMKQILLPKMQTNALYTCSMLQLIKSCTNEIRCYTPRRDDWSDRREQRSLTWPYFQLNFPRNQAIVRNQSKCHANYTCQGHCAKTIYQVKSLDARDLDYDWSLFHLVRRVWRERNPRVKKMAAHENWDKFGSPEAFLE